MTQKYGSTREKALQINLHPQRYGSFAEIGAGQEVVRWFFQAGGAAGTIAKSISAYDMKVSDAIYGECKRYVCRERLEAMLAYEQNLNRSRLTAERGENSAFFTFADTVSARNYHGTNECHGWLGIRFQMEPGTQDNSIVIHVRMRDRENALQQEALGITGVNLIYGAFFLADNPSELVASLLDNLGTDRIEVDMIEFSGPDFANVDNRVMTLRLVQLGMTGAAMFAADGKVLQPSEVLRKRPVVIERGRFRPLTHVNIDMLHSAIRRFESECATDGAETLALMEITMHDLRHDGEICLEDFVSRAEVLQATGHTVMISDFFEYYRLAAWLFEHTSCPIGLAIGLGTLESLFEEHYYQSLDGGILESLGRLFKDRLRLYVYPVKDPETGALRTVSTMRVSENLRHLVSYLCEKRCIVQLEDARTELLDIHSPEVLRKIAADSPDWDTLVPAPVADAIRTRGLFGYRCARNQPFSQRSATKAARTL